jgi:hypothetical protein
LRPASTLSKARAQATTGQGQRANPHPPAKSGSQSPSRKIGSLAALNLLQPPFNSGHADWQRLNATGPVQHSAPLGARGDEGSFHFPPPLVLARWIAYLTAAVLFYVAMLLAGGFWAKRRILRF